MAVLVNRDTNVLVLGITGRSGRLQTKVMLDYGTKVVAGVTPGKGGQMAEGVPVYDFVSEVLKEHRIDAAISFVPARSAKDSSFEAIDNGIKFLVLTMEEIPDHDVLEILSYAKAKGTTVLGPGAAGIISPGKCKLGAHPPRMFTEGNVGVVSKSGALSYEVGKTLTEAGIGQSTVIALGGGPLWGLTQRDAVRLFQEDPETEVILLLGEIGGTTEEEAAEFIAQSVTKPVVALIVGRAAPEGKSLGHAGAIIQGNRGTAQSKITALSRAGAKIATTPKEAAQIIKEIRGE
jgi:succinyl-CoA synthetase alpha subunit